MTRTRKPGDPETSASVVRILSRALEWLGPSVDLSDGGAVALVQHHHAGETLRGRVHVVEGDARVFDLGVDLQTPMRGIFVELKPKSEGMLSAFPDEFLGQYHPFALPDVELERYYVAMGTPSDVLRAAVHPLRQMRRTGGKHEGYLRLEGDRLRIALCEITLSNLRPALIAVGEIWRCIVDGSLDGAPTDEVPPPAVAPRQKSAPPWRSSVPESNIRSQVARFAESELGLDLRIPANRANTLLDASNRFGVWRIVSMPEEDAAPGEREGGDAASFPSEIQATFFNPTGVRFHITRENLMTHVGKWFGLKEVEIGVPSFDDAFFVRGTNETQLRQLLSDTQLRARARAVPFSEFSLEASTPQSHQIDVVKLAFPKPWVDSFSNLRAAMDLVNRVLTTLSPPTEAQPPLLRSIRETLVGLRHAQRDDVGYVNNRARCSFLLHDFTGSMKVELPNYETGTTSLFLSARVPSSIAAFELRPLRTQSPESKLPASFFAGAPPLPSSAVKETRQTSISRRVHLVRQPRAIALLDALAPRIEVLAHVLNSNAFAIRVVDGDLRVLLSDYAWKNTPEAADLLMQLWEWLVQAVDLP